MLFNQFGKSGMNVSRVGFGGIPIQRVDQEMVNQIVDQLAAEEINFIDTARGYTTSEEMIGIALQGRREKFFIATKSMSRDRESMRKDVQISLDNLQTDHIDLYQFHNVGSVEELQKIVGPNGAYEALKEMKDQGKVLHIGLTSHKVPVIEAALELGAELFESIQFPYNVVESQGKEVIRRAHEMGLGTIAMKPMAGGSLQNGRLAMKYLLEDQNLSVAIPGMEKVEEVVTNAGAADGVPMTAEERKTLQAEAEALGTTFCRRCQYCLPCPQGINIPMNFLLEGYVTRYHLVDWSVPRYQAQEVKADACIECGTCESRCPYNLPIREKLKEVVATFQKYEA